MDLGLTNSAALAITAGEGILGGGLVRTRV
jgi:hypothetical protein